MTEISAADVKRLREMTGAGMMDCKEALREAGGAFEAAKDVLRKKGLAAAARRAARTAAQGTVAAYAHLGRIGTLLELRCETDFVGRTPEFQAMAKALAMQVAAQTPEFLRREDVPPDRLERERAIYLEEASASGKPPAVVEKMIAGKLEKFFTELCLLDQVLVVPVEGVSEGTKVSAAVAGLAARVGEKIEVARFARFTLGEAA